MSFDWSHYNLQQLRSHAVDCYRQGGGSRPDVLVIEIGGQRAVLKDHNKMDRLFALLVGPLLVWREAKALRRLQAVSGVPKLLAIPDRRAILMDSIEARQIVSLDDDTIDWPVYFDDLRRLIDAMHAAGVAHGDLRSPTNALIDQNGQAATVDFVASLHRGHAANILNRYLFNKLCLVDLSAITKLKKRVAPELLGNDELESHEIAGQVGMAARAVGQFIRRFSRKLFTNK